MEGAVAGEAAVQAAVEPAAAAGRFRTCTRRFAAEANLWRTSLRQSQHTLISR